MVIAIAGVIDPSLSATRAVKADISLVSSSRLPDPALVDRVANALGSRFRVIRGASLGASATVLVGDTWSDAAQSAAPSLAFAVTPEPQAPFISVTSATMPQSAHLQSRIPVAVTARVSAARGRTATFTLSKDGVAIDRVTREIKGDDETLAVDLGYVATSTGAATLSVEASLPGARPGQHVVDLTVVVESARWAVLTFDRRPSWMSTFVRRALESDPRFVVTSRVVTSRGAATTAGQPPESLATLPSLEEFQTVIAGAPEALTTADVAGLESFMRERGGSVIVLIDEAAASPALRSLSGVARWAAASRAEPLGTPPASETFSPIVVAPWMQAVGHATWSMPVGRGRLLISGQLDAWRYRDRDSAAFDTHWRRAVAHVATAAQQAARAANLRAGGAQSRTPDADDRLLIRAWTA
ncbi:MAG TPA: hypothetical protein VFO31_02635, partial [Vicinamibacterales bacterium]|nr:hypothetical protein [Vicinamibacterales bacterium]